MLLLMLLRFDCRKNNLAEVDLHLASNNLLTLAPNANIDRESSKIIITVTSFVI